MSSSLTALSLSPEPRRKIGSFVIASEQFVSGAAAAAVVARLPSLNAFPLQKLFDWRECRQEIIIEPRWRLRPLMKYYWQILDETTADYGRSSLLSHAAARAVLNSFPWFKYSLPQFLPSRTATERERERERERHSTTLLIISPISPLACLPASGRILFVQFLNFSWKFKVSIESLISLKSSSSSGWVVGSERVPKSIWSPICLKERSQRDPFNFSSSPFSDVTRTIYVWSTLPPVCPSVPSVDVEGKGTSDRIDGARKFYTSTPGARVTHFNSGSALSRLWHVDSIHSESSFIFFFLNLYKYHLFNDRPYSYISSWGMDSVLWHQKHP